MSKSIFDSTHGTTSVSEQNEVISCSIPTLVIAPSWEQMKASGRSFLDTQEAAYYLRFRTQTLRRWACYDSGPIRPVRIGGRLRWRIADLQKLLEGEQ